MVTGFYRLAVGGVPFGDTINLHNLAGLAAFDSELTPELLETLSHSLGRHLGSGSPSNHPYDLELELASGRRIRVAQLLMSPTTLAFFLAVRA